MSRAPFISFYFFFCRPHFVCMCVKMLSFSRKQVESQLTIISISMHLHNWVFAMDERRWETYASNSKLFTFANQMTRNLDAHPLLSPIFCFWTWIGNFLLALYFFFAVVGWFPQCHIKFRWSALNEAHIATLFTKFALIFKCSEWQSHQLTSNAQRENPNSFYWNRMQIIQRR